MKAELQAASHRESACCSAEGKRHAYTCEILFYEMTNVKLGDIGLNNTYWLH